MEVLITLFPQNNSRFPSLSQRFTLVLIPQKKTANKPNFPYTFITAVSFQNLPVYSHQCPADQFVAAELGGKLTPDGSPEQTAVSRCSSVVNGSSSLVLPSGVTWQSSFGHTRAARLSHAHQTAAHTQEMEIELLRSLSWGKYDNY